MKNKSSSIIILLLIIIAGLLAYHTFWQKERAPKSNATSVNAPISNNEGTQAKTGINESREEIRPAEQSIDELTKEAVVVAYVKAHGKLPDNYITKREARAHGWNPSAGNLCDVLPGRAIGGDVFTNRERSLPASKGRIWYEADLNYNCGNRNADRILFSSDGLVYVTHNHYKTFEQQ